MGGIPQARAEKLVHTNDVLLPNTEQPEQLCEQPEQLREQLEQLCGQLEQLRVACDHFMRPGGG